MMDPRRSTLFRRAAGAALSLALAAALPAARAADGAPLLHALQSKRPKHRYPVTLPTRLFSILRRLLPSRWLDRILGKSV